MEKTIKITEYFADVETISSQPDEGGKHPKNTCESNIINTDSHLIIPILSDRSSFGYHNSD